jgi:hypothetical protein
MSQTNPFIAHRLFAFGGTTFDVQIVDLYPDLDNPRKYQFCWQVVCEGVTSPQKEVVVSLSHNLAEPPEINDETKFVLAEANLRLFAFWSDQGIVTISFNDGSANHISYTVDWHTKLKTFNPHAWAKAA